MSFLSLQGVTRKEKYSETEKNRNYDGIEYDSMIAIQI